ncbi:hypothetical protein AN640_03400 [Candidatus Epulonipiscium fishelsonii]|uniref:Uncharacterized protein n=1 Tax=Candidatus Epulonipiscium fishelsonii TaxID=77094 RepID=A0ACC8XJ88_9FIRM|nr:hypothetical protein AN640_03400 [Epulopiscium sp. SCG-D08WGA-EpuloA1]OON90940.1 MAG: hypothetical protein ATN32_02900 [Epulopiscium sp. AS2M-Bin002]
MKDKENFKEIDKIFSSTGTYQEIVESILVEDLKNIKNSNLHIKDYEIEIMKLELSRALKLYVYAIKSNQLNITILQNVLGGLAKLENIYDITSISIEISISDLDLIVKTTDKLAPKRVIVFNTFSTDIEILRYHLRLQEQFLKIV